jgi:hypothetical protein
MSIAKQSRRPAARRVAWGTVAAVGVLLVGTFALAGHQNNGRNRAVGGISISVEGVLAQPDAKSLKLVREQYLTDLDKPSPELNQPVEVRKISLRDIEAAVTRANVDLTYALPEEISFLAGIQRIQYIFVYPEENDIVLAGPGEGWKVDERANVVGVTTGRPVLRLEDLIVALRTVENARQGGITCSIDPTPEGRKQFEAFMGRQKQFSASVLDGIAKALGQQQISLTGVPATSRFARVLVASDYKMKRIAMDLEKSPVKGLPSFLDLMKTNHAPLTNMMPRWWMACDYQPLAKSPDGLAWEIRGPGVKVMTEDELITDEGTVQGTGKTNPVAQKWADTMSGKYEDLSVAEPVFGELRNIMDLCVVAALIAREDMLAKANLELPTLTSPASKLGLTEWNAPKTVSTQCSAVKRGREYIITASGGVAINSWEVASKSVESSEIKQVRAAAKKGAGSRLWWN